MNFEKNEIIKYRFNRASETILEAKLLAKELYWNTVANRVFLFSFSTFYT
jgi:hypothetical protein